MEACTADSSKGPGATGPPLPQAGRWWRHPGSVAACCTLLLASCGDGEPILFPPAHLIHVEGPATFDGTVAEPVASLPVVVVADEHGNPVPGATVRFRIDGGGGRVTPETVATDVHGRARPDEWVLGERVGFNVLTAEHDVGRIRFWAESEPGPPAEIEAASAEHQEGRAGLPVPLAPAVRVDDVYGNPVPRVEVRFEADSGSGSVEGSPAETDDAGVARLSSWTLGPVAGTQRLVAAVPDVGTVAFTAEALGEEADRFTIDLHFITSPSSAVREAFEAAVARWESIIDGDLAPIYMDVGATNCAPAMDRVVDDLLIFVTVASMDGEGGTLARAGPCWIRNDGDLPVVGRVWLDNADVEWLARDGLLETVILHEIGHVLGISSGLWRIFGYLEDPSLPDDRGADTHFTGPFATEAFDAIGGSSYTGGAKVPVENEHGGQGTRDSHWRHAVFEHELMSPFLDLGSNPLSRVTIASLRDLGYSVVMEEADAYSLDPAVRAPGPRRLIPLGDDHVYLGPVHVVGEDGEPLGVRRP